MKIPHKIAVIVFDGVVVGDLSVPVELFPLVRDQNGESCYEVQVCGHKERFNNSHLSVCPHNRLTWASVADTIIIPGIEDINQKVPEVILTSIREAKQRGVRIVSLCTGAFILAESGILEGLKATTHWMASSNFATRYQGIGLVPDVLFVDNGQVLTSAGAAAAFDLCLHLIRLDCGPEAALKVADLAVLPIERVGVQPQLNHFQSLPQSPILYLLNWIEENIDQVLTVEQIAKQGNMSSRTLYRHFMNHVGVAPAKWINMIRIRKAVELLESSWLSIEAIAETIGYQSAEVFRENFYKIAKTSPSEYRRILHRRKHSY